MAITSTLSIFRFGGIAFRWCVYLAVGDISTFDGNDFVWWQVVITQYGGKQRNTGTAHHAVISGGGSVTDLMQP